jgi:hypothetical protein
MHGTWAVFTHRVYSDTNPRKDFGPMTNNAHMLAFLLVAIRLVITCAFFSSVVALSCLIPMPFSCNHAG